MVECTNMARSSSRETTQTYNVFLSWSGERSLYVAQFFHGWLQKVLQRAKPWLSDRDIEKGTVGVDEIKKALAGMKVGIFFLTPQIPHVKGPLGIFQRFRSICDCLRFCGTGGCRVHTQPMRTGYSLVRTAEENCRTGQVRSTRRTWTGGERIRNRGSFRLATRSGIRTRRSSRGTARI